MKNKDIFKMGFYITSGSIILYKLMELLLLIPLKELVGLQVLASYSFAYAIFTILFTSVTVSLSMASMRTASNYHLLADEKARDIAGDIAKRLLLIFSSLISFIIIVLAPLISESHSLIIRIFVIAFLSLTSYRTIHTSLMARQEFDKANRIELYETILRIITLLIFAYISVKLKLNSYQAASFLASALVFSSLIMYLYSRNKFKLKTSKKKTNISTELIFKRIIQVAIPIVAIQFFKVFYNLIDIFFLPSIMKNFSYSSDLFSEVVLIYSLWGYKISEIIILLSLIPVMHYVYSIPLILKKKERKDLNRAVNNSIIRLLYTVLPMASLISFLSPALWKIFFFKEARTNVLSLYIFLAVFIALFTLVFSIQEQLKSRRTLYISLFSALLVKLIINYPLVRAFAQWGLPAYYGFIVASIITYAIAIIVSLAYLRIKFNISYERTAKALTDIIINITAVSLLMYLIKIKLPIEGTIIHSFGVIIVYSITYAIAYKFLAKKMKTVEYFKDET